MFEKQLLTTIRFGVILFYFFLNFNEIQSIAKYLHATLGEVNSASLIWIEPVRSFCLVYCLDSDELEFYRPSSFKFCFKSTFLHHAGDSIFSNIVCVMQCSIRLKVSIVDVNFWYVVASLSIVTMCVVQPVFLGQLLDF